MTTRSSASPPLGRFSASGTRPLAADAPLDNTSVAAAVPNGQRHQEDPSALAGPTDAWDVVRGDRSVLLAGPRSFCAGVERAIEIVERVLEQHGAPVYVRKEIVHNRYVVTDLAKRGAVFVENIDAVPTGATVVFSAHGVSPDVRAEAALRSLHVIDATCPLVAKVHAEARRFAGRGDTILLIGHQGHEEVEGTFGEAPQQMILVQNAAEAAVVEVLDPDRVSYLMQTTLSVDEAAEVVKVLQARFPGLRGPDSDDICYATTNRQEALRAMAGDADLVIVIGSENSSNSVRLVELARRAHVPAYLVDSAADLRPEWLRGVRVVGLTAGASAPPVLVEEIIAALTELGAVDVTEREIVRELQRFELPGALRSSGSDRSDSAGGARPQ